MIHGGCIEVSCSKVGKASLATAVIGCIEVSCSKVGKASLATAVIGGMAISSAATNGISVSASAVCVVDNGIAFFAKDGGFITADGLTIMLKE